MQTRISLRPVQNEDTVFLQAVYASTRSAELRLVDWSPEQKQAFIEMQFNAQKLHYSRYFPSAEYTIILRDQVPIGRMIVDRGGDSFLLMDITLLPEHCNQGIGSELIQNLMGEAERAGKPVRLHVESFNPAQRLYQRLGFRMVDETSFYHEMEWRPAVTEPTDRQGGVR